MVKYSYRTIKGDPTPQTVSEEIGASTLSPEEIYDGLKNQNGYLRSDYDDGVVLVIERLETEAEMLQRLADHSREQDRIRELARIEARKRADMRAIREQFREWRRSHPAYYELQALRRWSHQPGPLMAEQSERLNYLNDLLYSERSFENFTRFMLPG
jgi:hypothetical protein